VFIQVDVDRFTNRKRDFYDSQWNLLPFSWCPWKEGKPVWVNSGLLHEAPKLLPKMIQISEKLAANFIYARIDLYYFKEKIYFGEITFHHGSGNEIFDPLIYDEIFGKKLVLKPKSVLAPD
jgi:hypothetical protein